eukprot:TRINITY_DN1406_c0_g1_i2.p1 TRINITY_DN1406_c0_g1~~TRINITY_DN1406_c0_g1_i2.p1  ORF type:complete len:366 (-),score=98.59 TRINITY_DN1406_c0_g1_i2:1229-2326(-)
MSLMAQFLTLENARGFIYAFAKGFADSLRGAVDLFLLDSRSVRDKELQLLRKELTRDILLSREPRGSEPLGMLAKRRSVERRLREQKQKSFSSSLGSEDSLTSGLKRSPPRILERTLKCCALNGCVFWLSIVLFERAVLPTLKMGLFAVLGEPRSNLGERLWSLTLPLLSTTFSALWVLPFFLLSKVVNAIWFQDIADSAFKSSRSVPQSMPSLTLMIADTVFSILIESLFLLQGKLCSYLPIALLGRAVNLLHLALLHSLYCFEYKWFNQGLELHKRLYFIEANWPYFLGFGLPLALLTSLPDNWVVSGCVFSMLFPLFIVSGNQAQVVTGSVSVALHLFSPTIFLSNALFAKLFERRRVLKSS